MLSLLWHHLSQACWLTPQTESSSTLPASLPTRSHVRLCSHPSRSQATPSGGEALSSTAQSALTVGAQPCPWLPLHTSPAPVGLGPLSMGKAQPSCGARMPPRGNATAHTGLREGAGAPQGLGGGPDSAVGAVCVLPAKALCDWVGSLAKAIAPVIGGAEVPVWKMNGTHTASPLEKWEPQ